MIPVFSLNMFLSHLQVPYPRLELQLKSMALIPPINSRPPIKIPLSSTATPASLSEHHINGLHHLIHQKLSPTYKNTSPLPTCLAAPKMAIFNYLNSSPTNPPWKRILTRSTNSLIAQLSIPN